MTDETGVLSHAAARLKRDFIERFAATRKRLKPPIDLDFLASSIVDGLGGDDHVPDQPTLEKAAKRLAESTNGWPLARRFTEALKAVIGDAKPGKGYAPQELRWKPDRPGHASAKPQFVNTGGGPNGTDGLLVSEADWQAAREKQERAAVNLLREDLTAQAMVKTAHEQDWLVALADFVVEHGRLPDPNEERKCRGQAARSREELAALEVQELEAQNRLIERVARGEKVPKGTPEAATISSTALRRLRATMVDRWAGLVVK